ncbi:MAG: orotidine-5'-phosphate decarboxylase [Patescibacteria group bacterium]
MEEKREPYIVLRRAPKQALESKNRIIVALDVDDVRKAMELVDLLRDHVGAFKIGLEFNTSSFAKLVTTDATSLNALWYGLAQLFDKFEGRLMYDGKFDDIPKTMAGAAKGLAPINPMFFTVHASATIDGMMAAVANKGESKVLAVTVLTSIEENEAHLDFGSPSKAKVLQYARDAMLAGCDGIVCSPKELELLAKRPELKSLIKVTPGVRPAGADVGDQKRVMTPGEAIKAGADYLVIGRPITDAQDPVNAADAIAKEIEEATK